MMIVQPGLMTRGPFTMTTPSQTFAKSPAKLKLAMPEVGRCRTGDEAITKRVDLPPPTFERITSDKPT
jgi:hypothetical protein